MSAASQVKPYKIGGRKYWIAMPLQWRQWKSLMAMVEKARVGIRVKQTDGDTETGEKGEKEVQDLRPFKMMSALVKNNSVRLFLSLVLAREGKEWKRLPRILVWWRFRRVKEDVILEVISDFFLNRTQLLNEVVSFFTPSIRQWMSTMRELQPTSSESNSQDQSLSTDRTSITGQFSNSKPATESPQKSEQSE